MGSVDRPTREELLEIARDPEAAKRALERYGMNVLMDPYGSESGIGLGDLVAKATKAVGIKPCAPCEERRRKLNRWRIG